VSGGAAASTLAQEKAGLSRRALLRRATAFGGALVLAPHLLDFSSAEAAASAVTSDPELHLLRRATYGPTTASLAHIRKIGRNAWIEEQLAPSSIRDKSCAKLMSTRFPGLKWSIAQANTHVPAFAWDLMFDLGTATLARACWSSRQLGEVMVDFWSNHLNVTNPSDTGWNCRHDYDRHVIRHYALGRFVDMLKASAQHPAMLQYLNNAESSKTSPNENYGRELLELHTVGVDGGYTETDMRNSALVLTGLSVDGSSQYVYRPTWHYTGPIQVMGWSSSNATGAGGYAVAMSYLDYLAHHPATAKRIATKLCERFVSDSPPASLVNALAATYLANGTAMVPVLRQLFRSSGFAGSIGAKVRRPMEDLVATVRALGIRPDSSGKAGMQDFYWMLDDLGNSPGAWPQPNGYPDVAASWASAGGTLGRWNDHMSLAAHWWPDKLRRPSLASYLPKPLPATHGALVQDLAKRLVFRSLPAAQRNAICGFLGVGSSTPLHSSSEAVGWRLPYVMALILDTPSHEVR
jgi:uncharacterized protein (DUF1800 family)